MEDAYGLAAVRKAAASKKAGPRPFVGFERGDFRRIYHS
jgi:hypothetical protein